MQIDEKKLGDFMNEVVTDTGAATVAGGGLSRMRRATETPFDIVLEARP